MDKILLFIKKHKVKLIVGLLLTIMFFLMLTSSIGDSGIVDEVAHIPAGYSYLTTGDFRINPEHPPLIKDLSAVPLLFLGLNFPYNYFRAFRNNQWELGWKFIYHSGNDADSILFWSRLPIILLSLFLGYFVFKWARELYGAVAGIFALFLYTFSPNVIAHSRFVTTDLGIAFFYVLTVYFLGRFLKKPDTKNLIIAGVIFGLAQLSKFSAVLLGPTFIILVILKAYSEMKFPDKGGKPWISNLLQYLANKKVFLKSLKYFAKLILIFLIGLGVIILFYWFHTFRMPVSVQEDLISESIPTNVNVQNILIGIARYSRPLAQYLLGLAMVIFHVESGHTAFLIGNFSRVGWWYYFPVAFLIKTPIVTLILILLAILFLSKKLRRKIKQALVWQWDFSEWLLIVPVVFYFYFSIQGSLNIGIRHLLPIYPFIFIYVSKLTKLIPSTNYQILKQKWKFNISTFSLLIFTILCSWYLWTSISIYPHYVAYFNETVRPQNGYKYLVNSSLDWGQDLKRLARYVEDNNIKNIKVDYFGGGVPQYYIPDAIEWHSNYGQTSGPIAVSATFLQMSKYFGPQEGKPTYNWLEDDYKPEAQIGYSIFVYDIPGE